MAKTQRPLLGFPDIIEVTCGSAWSGTFPVGANPILPDEIIILHKANENQWTENGTDVYNILTNRLGMNFDAYQTAGQLSMYMHLQIASGISFGSFGSAINTVNVGPHTSGYNFLTLFSGLNYVNGSWSTLAFGSGALYNPDIFSLIREYVAAESSGGQANRLLMGVG